MTPNRLLDHFDRISDAPDAIPRLRRFILDLAVRGKLVEQDPNDEPASEVLRRIHVENSAHKNDGKKSQTGRSVSWKKSNWRCSIPPLGVDAIGFWLKSSLTVSRVAKRAILMPQGGDTRHCSGILEKYLILSAVDDGSCPRAACDPRPESHISSRRSHRTQTP